MAWIGDGLRRLYPVPVPIAPCEDPLGAIVLDALEENRQATIDNRRSAHESIAVMQSWMRARRIDQGLPNHLN